MNETQATNSNRPVGFPKIMHLIKNLEVVQQSNLYVLGNEAGNFLSTRMFKHIFKLRDVIIRCLTLTLDDKI